MSSEEIERRETDKKVRCRTCLTHNFVRYKANWIEPSSFKNHTTTDIHKDSVIRRAAAAKKQERLANELAASQSATSYATPNTLPPMVPASGDHSLPQGQQMKDLWDAHGLDRPDCSMNLGPENIEVEERTKFYKKITDYGLWDGLEVQGEDGPIHEILQRWEEEEDDDVLTEILRNQEQAEKDGAPEAIPVDTDHAEWFPYPSKVMFLLDTIDNLPRQRISGTLMKVILWLLTETGVKHVPSFNALRAFQKSLRSDKGVPTIQWKSSKGNIFSFNDPQALIANDWSNPLTRPHIRRYPVIPRNGVISEVWHARKWHDDLDHKVRSPMYDAGNDRHYYIDEPAALEDGKIVIPVRWLEDEDGAVWMDVWTVVQDEVTGTSTIVDDTVLRLRADTLRSNMLDLIDEKLLPKWCDQTIEKDYPSRMPNPDRALAGGDPLYTCFIDIFGDDVSGNRSKSWNKHWNIYMNNRNLPRHLLFQQYHTHFLSTSTHASVPEQFEGIKSRIEETHSTPLAVRDGITGKATKLKIFCNCGPGDNPSQSETSGHIGGKGNYPCRKCTVGGTQKEKESDCGYHSLFVPGTPRSAQDTLTRVKEQVAAACTGIADRVKELQTATGVKDSFTQPYIEDIVARARTMKKSSPNISANEVQRHLLTWADENRARIYNPFLSTRGFDASLDTPVEILHTILLGIAKYAWHVSHTSWDSQKKTVFSTRLQATSTVSLSIPAIRSLYIMQYANSLIGRQLKTLVQLNAFCTYDLVDGIQYSLIKAIGELSALLWFPEIQNLDQYLDHVDKAAANVLDIAAKVDPSKIISKIKYHLLVHLREDILRFGPLVGVASEIFECFNAIFRFCSILSNHLSPSRDIALQLAGQETVKHMLSGGWWHSKATNNWERSGPRVRSYITGNSILQHLCGWVKNPVMIPGSVKLEPEKRDKETKKLLQRIALPWSDTLASRSMHSEPPSRYANLRWLRCRSTVSSKGDKCYVGTWIFAKSPFAAPAADGRISLVCGRIVEIIQDTEAKSAWLVLDIYSISAERHPIYGMPILSRRLNEESTVTISTNDILFDFNVQHDCSHAGCSSTGSKKVVQERTETDQVEECVEHNPVDRHVINMHAFHNAHCVRSALPLSLTEPTRYVEDREAYHHQVASGFRDVQREKREAQARKAEEKKAKAAKEKQAADSGTGSGNKRKRADTVMGSSVEDHDVPMSES